MLRFLHLVLETAPPINFGKQLFYSILINRAGSGVCSPPRVVGCVAPHYALSELTPLLLIREGILPAKQLMPSAPWQVPVLALESEAVKIGVREIVARRPRNFAVLQDEKTLKLPGL